MNAKEAREQATERSKILSDKQYEIIKDTIQSAVNAGRFSVITEYDKLYDQTVERLKKEGFIVTSLGITEGSKISWK